MRKKLLLATPFVLIAVVLFSSIPALASITIEGEVTFWDQVLVFLTNDIVRTVLLILGIAGIIIEIATVGSFGIFGVVGLISFVLYFIGNIWAGTFGLTAVLLLIGGIILIIIEIFVIPGFGVAGVAGLIAFAASLVVAAPNPATAIWSVVIAIVVSIGIIWFTLKNKTTRKFWKKLILSQKSAEKEGYSSSNPELPKYMGAKGQAVTTLRPAGSAIIDGDKIDVVTNGEFIEEGAQIEVILVEGTRVVVQEIDSSK